MPSPARLVALALALAACAPAQEPETPALAAGEEPAGREWPAGTVLAVDDVPILAGEVDAATVAVQRIERRATDPQLRRLALTNIVLPRALTRLMAPAERERALDEARATLASLRAGEFIGPPVDGRYGELRTGNFHRLGLELWSVGQELAEGEWSEPIEQDGAFLLARRLDLSASPVPIGAEVELDVLAFPFVDGATYALDLEAAYDRHRLTIVDPAWRELVPELLQYRMGARTP